MRQKIRNRQPAPAPPPVDPTPIDLGDTARQIALFETGNGMQNGLIDILFALAAALFFLPMCSSVRSRTKDRR
jgi:hypothetical protein